MALAARAAVGDWAIEMHSFGCRATAGACTAIGVGIETWAGLCSSYIVGGQGWLLT